MNIEINGKVFVKENLVALIKKSKLKTIAHLRSTTNISLKDAKDIVDNLEADPNYYDSTMEGEAITIGLKGAAGSDSNRNEDRKAGPRIIKNEQANRKWLVMCAFILLGIILYFMMAN